MTTSPVGDRLPLAGPNAVAARMAGRTIRLTARGLMRGKVDLTVSGQHHVPADGPVVLAARHYHHLFDGTALLTTVGRPLRVMVALDWLNAGPQRRIAERMCAMAGWPVVLRPDAELYRPDLAADLVRTATYQRETTSYLKRAAGQSVEILRHGEALLMFPEGYPNIDPSFTPKGESNDDFLRTLPGAVRIPLLAQSAGLPPVPIVPVGFHYQRTGPDAWRIQLRYGKPMYATHRRAADQAVTELGQHIRALSREHVP